MSPELVLVDPVLGEHARAWLPRPDDTLERLDRIIRARRLAAARARRTESELPATRPPHLKGRRPSAALAGAVAAAALAAALLGGVRVDLQGHSAGADTVPIDAPYSPLPGSELERQPRSSLVTPSPKGEARRPQPPRAVTVRRFVWAPVAGTSGYHVAFFRGSSLIFSADTNRPEVSVPGRWKFAGQLRTLAPGAYRWYVWPVTSGTRASAAVVQAELVVPPR